MLSPLAVMQPNLYGHLVNLLQNLGNRSKPTQRSSIKGVAVLAALFWLFTYLMLSVRAELLPGEASVFSERRFLLTCAGALIYGAALRCVAPLAKSPQSRVLLVSSLVVAAALLLFTARLAYETATFGRPSFNESGRWILVWAGYFAAWLLGFVAMQPRWAGAGEGEPTEAVGFNRPLSSAALWVGQGRGLVQVQIAEISRIASEGNYARVIHSSGTGLIREPLSKLETKLDQHGFVRVHRSALCNQSRMKAIRRSKSGTLLVCLEDGVEIPVGRRYASRVTQLLKS